jgi:hypothetical protein
MGVFWLAEEFFINGPLLIKLRFKHRSIMKVETAK